MMSVITRMTFLSASLLLFSLAFAAPTQVNGVARQNKKCPIHSVCFAIDQSRSVGGFYPQEQEFVTEIARTIASRTTNTLYSAYGFSIGSELIQSSTADLENTFLPAVNKRVRLQKRTDMYEGLTSCFDEIKGDKGNRLIVLITDGKDNGTPMASSAAPGIKGAGVSIVTVGIGDNVDVPYLEGLASGPKFFVKASAFSTLITKALDVVEGSCEVVASPLPTPTPGASGAATPAPPSPSPQIPVVGSCAGAYDACDFKFAGEDAVPTFSVTGKPDKPFTPVIVSRKKGEILGVLNSNNLVPEFILADGTVQEITDAGATPAFQPTHFKPLPIADESGSGIGHQTYHGGQKKVAKGKCVRVYFSSYQVLAGSPSPSVVDNIHVDSKSANKCVVFQSK